MNTFHPWRTRRVIALWAALGAAAFVLLPWYFLQRGSLLEALPGLWGAAASANGWTQMSSHARPWLGVGMAGLLLAASAVFTHTPRRQGLLLCSGAGLGLAGLVFSGFAIGMVGWTWDWLTALAGATDYTQPGMGWGAMVLIVSLLALLSIGVARLGGFKGDAFVAGAVLCCTALLALFVVYPVLKSLIGSVLNDEEKTHST